MLIAFRLTIGCQVVRSETCFPSIHIGDFVEYYYFHTIFTPTVLLSVGDEKPGVEEFTILRIDLDLGLKSTKYKKLPHTRFSMIYIS
jgi:hypothetical protein